MNAPEKSVPGPRKFLFVGGSLCLDFCNTVGGLRGKASREDLRAYPDFANWCRQAGLLDKAEAEDLVRRAASRPGEAVAALTRAIELRETLYRIFAATSRRERPSSPDLERLNGELAGTLGRQRVAPRGGGFGWEWGEGEGALDGALGPIAHSAADLLTSPDVLRYVRECEGDTCGWLFVDGTKNHSRRWCDMGDCGNRAKARRFRLKQRRARKAG